VAKIISHNFFFIIVLIRECLCETILTARAFVLEKIDYCNVWSVFG